MREEAERPYRYESNRRGVLWITIVMVIWSGLAIAAAVTEVSQSRVLERWRDEGFTTVPPTLSAPISEADANEFLRFASANGQPCTSLDDLFGFAAGCDRVIRFNRELGDSEDNGRLVFAGLVFALIAGGVLIASFTYQAHRNLLALKSEETRFGSNAAALWLFVPIINFYRGTQIFTELWKGSDPEADTANPTAWKASVGSTLIPLWWLSFTLVFGSWVWRALFTTASDNINDRIDSLRGLLLISDLFLIVPAVMAVAVVLQIHRRQERRFQVVGPHLAVPKTDFGQTEP